MAEPDGGTDLFEADVLVIGGGTAGPLAAHKAKAAIPALKVVLLEKANVKRSGAIAIGMDGLNNAVVPGFATPEQYVREITIANDGIVYQKAILAYATRSFEMIRELGDWGVKFQKDENRDYDVKKVHHLGSYVLPMPEGGSVKKILYRQLPHGGYSRHSRQGGDPDGGSRWTARPAGVRLSLGDIREPDQLWRRPRHGLSCRRRAHQSRVLSD